MGRGAGRAGCVTMEILRQDYELDEEEISDARRWWREVRKYEPLAA